MYVYMYVYSVCLFLDLLRSVVIPILSTFSMSYKKIVLLLKRSVEKTTLVRMWEEKLRLWKQLVLICHCCKHFLFIWTYLFVKVMCKRCLWNINCLHVRRAQIFQKSRKHLKIPGTGRVTKRIPYWGSPHTRCQRTKASHHGNLAPRICAHLHYAFIWELRFTQKYCHSHRYIFKAFTYPPNRIFLTGCYSNNFAFRKKIYYLFSIYSLLWYENSSVYRIHSTSILSVDVKTKITKWK